MRPLIALVPLLAFLAVACSDKSEGAPAEAAAPSPAVDLMAALKKSVGPGGAKAEPKAPVKKAPAKKPAARKRA